MTGAPPPKPKGLLKWGKTCHDICTSGISDGCLVILRSRKTGRTRQTILAVAHYDSVMLEYVVGAAHRSQSDWYQNILAHPALLVQIGRRPYEPLQRQLASEEALTTLRDCQKRHPWLFRQFIRPFGLPYPRVAQRGSRSA